MFSFNDLQVVEDGYEFFASRQLVTIFSAPNYCGEFDNAGAMMSVDATLMCSFQILKPADKKPKFSFGSAATFKSGAPPGRMKVHSYLVIPNTWTLSLSINVIIIFLKFYNIFKYDVG